MEAEELLREARIAGEACLAGALETAAKFREALHELGGLLEDGIECIISQIVFNRILVEGAFIKNHSSIRL